MTADKVYPQMIPLKRVARINERTLGEDTPADRLMRYVDISNVSDNGQILEPQVLTFENSPSRARRLVTSGDTIISTVRTYLKAIAYLPDPDSDTVVSTGFAVLTPRPEVDSRYLAWAVRSDSFVGDVVSRSVGVSYPAIAPTELGDIPVPVHPIGVQRKIADFLDRETAKIDKLIKEKEDLLKLLDERRQALIMEAVTRGLDPTVPMKDSGLPWLGMIPAHWIVAPLKHVAKTVIGLTYSPEDVTNEGSGTLVLRASNVQSGQLVHADDVFVASSIPSELVLRIGDILVCARSGSRDLIGKNALVTSEFEGCSFGAFMTVIRSPINDYLRIVLASSLFEFHTGSYMTTTINQLTQETLGGLIIPIPPETERTRIGHAILEMEQEMARARTQLQAGIGLLRDRRSALVHEAVTGRSQVGGAA